MHVNTCGKSNILFPVVLHSTSVLPIKVLKKYHLRSIATLVVDIEYSKNHIRRCNDYAENKKTIMDRFITFIKCNKTVYLHKDRENSLPFIPSF